MAQGTQVINIFTYLGSSISSIVNIKVKVKKRVTKTAAVIARLSKRVWNNSILTEKTKLWTYQACILSVLLYGSEMWTM